MNVRRGIFGFHPFLILEKLNFLIIYETFRVFYASNIKGGVGWAHVENMFRESYGKNKKKIIKYFAVFLICMGYYLWKKLKNTEKILEKMFGPVKGTGKTG